MTWIICRTDFRKEAYVATAIRRLGYDAWVPSQMIISRPAIARRVTAKAAVQVKELPILPKRLFVCIANQWDVIDLAGIRHFEEVERDGEERIITIPDNQIAAFRAEIDRENTASLALAQAKNRKQRARWRSLHDALLELVEGAKQQMEQAA